MVPLFTSPHTSTEATTSLTFCRTAQVHQLGHSRPCIAYRLTPVQKRGITAFAKNAKRVKYSQADSHPARGEPLFIQVEPDASDAWRLNAVVDGLKSGSVSVWLLILCLRRVTEPFVGNLRLKMYTSKLYCHCRLVSCPQTRILHWFVTSATEEQWRSCTTSKAFHPKSNLAYYVGTYKTSAPIHWGFLPATELDR